MIKITGTYRGIEIDFNKGVDHILFPRINMWLEIVIHNNRREQVVYKTFEEFLSDWGDLKPYEGCKEGREFIEKEGKV